MDEPTNHLDITSKEILENAINNYTGTVLYVSHDRYFINRTATRILDLTNQTFLNYLGNYDYYLEKKPEMEWRAFGNKYGSNSDANNNVLDGLRIDKHLDQANKELQASSYPQEPVSENKLDWQQQKEEQAKLRKRQNDLKKVEDEITRMEARNEELEELLADSSIYTNSSKLIEVHKEKKEVEEKLEALMEQWEELSE